MSTSAMSQDNTPRTSALVCINSVEIQPIVVREQRVLTLTQIDKVHARPEGTARRNFNENKNRLIEGQDYFVVSADEIRTHSPDAVPAARKADMTVVTESGYLLLVKSFTDDLAWQIQRELVNAYFRVDPPRTVGESYETLIPSEQQTLSEIVHSKVAHLAPELQGKALAEAWSRLHRKFRIAKYSQLARTQLAEAILYVTSMDLRSAPAVSLDIVNSADLQKLSQIVYLIRTNFHLEGAASHAAYAHLRKQFGLEKGIASLPTLYLDQATQILSELQRLSFAFKGLVMDAERKFFRQVLRAGNVLDEDAFSALFDAELQQMMENHRDSLKLLN